MDYCIMLTTCPEENIAKEISLALVNSRLAACVTVMPPGLSIYRWQDKIHEDREHVLIIKTRDKLVEQIISRIRTIHPYEVPEIIVLPIIQGFDAYLNWLSEETRTRE